MAELMAGLQARVVETLPPSMGYIAGLVEILLETSSLMVLTFLGPVLLRLYLHGPSLWNFGFWASVSPLEICNRISTAAPEFWIARADACQDLIFARFHGFFLGWCALGYLAIVVLMIPWTLRMIPWLLRLVPWGMGMVPWIHTPKKTRLDSQGVADGLSPGDLAIALPGNDIAKMRGAQDKTVLEAQLRVKVEDALLNNGA